MAVDSSSPTMATIAICVSRSLNPELGISKSDTGMPLTGWKASSMVGLCVPGVIGVKARTYLINLPSEDEEEKDD